MLELCHPNCRRPLTVVNVWAQIAKYPNTLAFISSFFALFHDCNLALGRAATAMHAHSISKKIPSYQE